jgi:sortase A
MAKGVAVLGETSLPVRGENTNVVIAGHRGYWGTAMFRDIQLIQIGDKITITTPWDTLIYRVCELKIITPDDTNAVLIQPGRQLLTLLTCHPYTQNYQRYLVFAELSDEEPEQDKKEDLAEAEKTFDDSPRTVVSSDGEGNVQEVQVEPVSIQPVANEGAQLESGAAYSNTMLLIEKYAPPVVIGLLVLLLLVKLLRKRKEG